MAISAAETADQEIGIGSGGEEAGDNHDENDTERRKAGFETFFFHETAPFFHALGPGCGRQGCASNRPGFGSGQEPILWFRRPGVKANIRSGIRLRQPHILENLAHLFE